MYAHHAFDMNTDTWSAVASLPQDEQRQYANGFSLDSMGYVFGGINNTGFLNDLWQYNPKTNSWTEKTALPAANRGGAASFVINNIAYIVGGKNHSVSAMSEVWSYDMLNDNWQQKNITGLTKNGIRLTETWKWVDPTSLKEQLIYNNFKMYPNPATDQVIIEYPIKSTATNSSYSIFDSKGSLLKLVKFSARKQLLILVNFLLVCTTFYTVMIAKGF